MRLPAEPFGWPPEQLGEPATKGLVAAFRLSANDRIESLLADFQPLSCTIDSQATPLDGRTDSVAIDRN